MQCHNKVLLHTKQTKKWEKGKEEISSVDELMNLLKLYNSGKIVI